MWFSSFVTSESKASDVFRRKRSSFLSALLTLRVACASVSASRVSYHDDEAIERARRCPADHANAAFALRQHQHPKLCGCSRRRSRELTAKRRPGVRPPPLSRAGGLSRWGAGSAPSPRVTGTDAATPAPESWRRPPKARCLGSRTRAVQPSSRKQRKRRAGRAGARGC